MVEQSKRKAYPTDLSDVEWQIIEPLLPKPKTRRGRPRKHTYRETLNAIFYVLRSGCAWRMLPHDFPAWQTVYHYFRQWRQDGTWARVHEVLRRQTRVQAGRHEEPSAAILDSQSVKTTEKGGPVAMMRARR
jgi:putative transposase